MKPQKRITSVLTEIVFPNMCCSCERYLVNTDTFSLLCNKCFSLIPLSPLKCELCNTLNSNGYFCQLCKPRVPFLNGLLSATPFSHPIVNTLIKNLKYHLMTSVAPILASLVARQLATLALPTPPTVIPLPIDPVKLRERGFNQNELVLQALSPLTPLRIIAPLLRTKESIPQASIGEHPQLRQINIQSVFTLEQRQLVSIPKNSRLYIFDDVFTTGATMSEAAKQLFALGYHDIWGLVVARS